MKRWILQSSIVLLSALPVTAFALDGVIAKHSASSQKRYCIVQREDGTHQWLPCSWGYVSCGPRGTSHCTADPNQTDGGGPPDAVNNRKIRKTAAGSHLNEGDDESDGPSVQGASADVEKLESVGE